MTAVKLSFSTTDSVLAWVLWPIYLILFCATLYIHVTEKRLTRQAAARERARAGSHAGEDMSSISDSGGDHIASRIVKQFQHNPNPSGGAGSSSSTGGGSSKANYDYKNIFHLFILTYSAIRCMSFIAGPLLTGDEEWQDLVLTCLTAVPDPLVFITFLMILILWAETIKNPLQNVVARTKRITGVLAAIAVVLQCLCFVPGYFILSMNMVWSINIGFWAGISLLTGGGFTFYGIYLMAILRPRNSNNPSGGLLGDDHPSLTSARALLAHDSLAPRNNPNLAATGAGAGVTQPTIATRTQPSAIAYSSVSKTNAKQTAPSAFSPLPSPAGSFETTAPPGTSSPVHAEPNIPGMSGPRPTGAGQLLTHGYSYSGSGSGHHGSKPTTGDSGVIIAPAGSSPQTPTPTNAAKTGRSSSGGEHHTTVGIPVADSAYTSTASSVADGAAAMMQHQHHQQHQIVDDDAVAMMDRDSEQPILLANLGNRMGGTSAAEAALVHQKMKNIRIVAITGAVCFVLRAVLLIIELYSYVRYDQDPQYVLPDAVYIMIFLLFYLGAEVFCSFAIVLTLMRPKPDPTDSDINIAIDEAINPPAAGTGQHHAAPNSNRSGDGHGQLSSSNGSGNGFASDGGMAAALAADAND